MRFLSLAVIALAAQAASGGLREGLVAYWDFDHVMGRLIQDASDRGNDIVVSEAVLVSGAVGRGLLCKQDGGYVACPDSPDFRFGDSLSVEAWIQPHRLPAGAYPAIVRKDGSFALRFRGNRLGFLIWVDGHLVTLEGAQADWKRDAWYHAAATYDGTQLRLFINGREDASSPQPMTGSIDDGQGPVGIGSLKSSYRFQGIIDEVRLWNRALSHKEVQSLYQQGLASRKAEKNEVVEPLRIGGPWFQLRKPKRTIRMVQDGFLWIDAEDFTDYGGWTLDTQFVHLMGSAYLIAAGAGTPVEDATVEVDVPKAGTYRLWVRAKNWLPDQGYSPGRFAVRVGDMLSDKDFGIAETAEWIWESGGEFQLPAGRARIALHDLTGYYGRCDALILTTDLKYVPPAGLEQVRAERSRLTGLSLEPEPAGEYDVIVVGAGAAGCCAAIAAARMGAKTALIQNRPVLGGNASVELGVSVNGAASSHRNARESGIIEEAGRIKARYGFPRMSEAFRILAEREPNLSVFLNEHVFDAVMANEQTIQGVKSVNTLDGTISLYRGKMFLDCTGDGWVGYFAGAEYRIGREARSEFNESLAPEKPDEITMSGCLMGQLSLGFRSVDTGRPVQYIPPPWAAKLPKGEQFGRRIKSVTGGNWWLEHPGTIDDLWDAERARDELIRISFGYWDYIKNSWSGRKQAETYQLVYVPITNAKRESRRLIGDYILTQNDVQSARVFPDRISYGGWPLDVHHPKGVFSGPEGPFDFDPRVPIYTIPFRCLYSKNIDNLLMAGRDVSVTHVALGSVRVQATLATLGQAAGTAAALCLRHRVTPRGLYENYIAELQQTLLKHDQYIPQLKNEDPNDLARTAKVTASSTSRFEPFGRSDVIPTDTLHPLNMPRAVMVPRGVRARWEALSLLLDSQRETAAQVTLHVRGAASSGDFSSTDDLALVTAAVPPKRETFVRFPIGRTISAPFVWVWLEPAEGISWRLMQKAPAGACRAYGGRAGRKWTVVSTQYYCIAVEPPISIATDYAPENVINGVARIVGKTSNMWQSDPQQPLPQWIMLEFSQPTRLNTVYLTFDTEMNNRWHDVAFPRECVRDYELSFYDGTRWIPLARVSGNYQRRRVHRFDPVTASRLKLTVLRTNGHPAARIFEIRAYDEP